MKKYTIKRTSIKKINIIKNQDVYDLTTEKNHNFFANNLLIHNCGEICLPSYGSCCLGSINLSNMYDEEKNDVNWTKLAKTINIAIRFLDNVLSINTYPISECKSVAEQSRRIGLGVMGLHYLIIKMGMKYGKKKSLEFVERLFTTIRNEAFEVSIDLAAEKSPFQSFDYDEYINNDYISKLPPRLLRKMKKQGIRNAVILTVPPTGTTSQLANVSSGIEPIFASIYKRRYRTDHDEIREDLLVDSLVVDHYNQNKSLAHFVSAYDVSPEEHIAMQAAIQTQIDGSISKTVALSKDFDDYDELSSIIFDYSKYLKGLTLYKQGSRGQEPLTEIKFETKKELGEYIKKAVNVSVAEMRCSTGVCEL